LISYSEGTTSFIAVSKAAAFHIQGGSFPHPRLSPWMFQASMWLQEHLCFTQAAQPKLDQYYLFVFLIRIPTPNPPLSKQATNRLSRTCIPNIHIRRGSGGPHLRKISLLLNSHVLLACMLCLAPDHSQLDSRRSLLDRCFPGMEIFGDHVLTVQSVY
jgi:hypothetical protein